jgi:hypothetical protein
MAEDREQWRPGSFTKNFSWGQPDNGLLRLHEAIRAGFDGKVEDVERAKFRERVRRIQRPDYIPLNFFLFNRTRDGIDYVVADELVYQALTFEHSRRFDKLALLTFNLSMAGKWKGAERYQSTPALWAKHYVSDRVNSELRWDTSQISADDIERFVLQDQRYIAQGARKLATNLAYLYRVGGLTEMASAVVERWWVDGVFVALDRAIETRQIEGKDVLDHRFDGYLIATGFEELSRRSLEKDLAREHLVQLYKACGGRHRFAPEEVRERTATLVPEIQGYLSNDNSPIAAIHPSNPRILKTLPRVCAMLARYAAGFEILDVDDLVNLDVSTFIRDNLNRALSQLKDRKISPTISAEELIKLLRDK